MNYKRDLKPESENETANFGTIIVRGLSIAVRVLDRKVSYNKRRYLVTPISGSGEIWVETVYAKNSQNDGGL